MDLAIRVLTSEEMEGATLLKEIKGGKLLRDNKTIYFQHPSQTAVHAYPVEYLDYILEWANTDLRLSEEQRKIVFEEKGKRKAPVCCMFRNKVSSDYCFLVMSHLPPPMNFFSEGYKPAWHYLDQVIHMSASPRAVSYDVWSAMERRERKLKQIISEIRKLRGYSDLTEDPEYKKIMKHHPLPIIARDAEGRLFKFSRQQQLVYRDDINPLSFLLIADPSVQQVEDAIELSLQEDPNADRMDYRPPATHIYIIADAGSDAGDTFFLDNL